MAESEDPSAHDAGLPEAAAPPEDAGLPEEDTSPGWTTTKVVGLVATVAFMAVLVALALQSRYDGEAADSVDVGFMQDMIYHHEQAIELGLIGTENATDHSVRHFSQEAIVAQQFEIGYMTSLLEDWGYNTGDADRLSMEWMDHGTPLEKMPGIVPAEQMAAFRAATGSDVDREFIRLMTGHHFGGIHMAEYAAENANDPRVRELAGRMATNQRYEIKEYGDRAEALGFQS